MKQLWRVLAVALAAVLVLGALPVAATDHGGGGLRITLPAVMPACDLEDGVRVDLGAPIHFSAGLASDVVVGTTHARPKGVATTATSWTWVSPGSRLGLTGSALAGADCVLVVIPIDRDVKGWAYFVVP